MGRFLIIDIVKSNFAISEQDLLRMNLNFLNFLIRVLMRSFNVSIRNGVIGLSVWKPTRNSVNFLGTSSKNRSLTGTRQSFTALHK